MLPSGLYTISFTDTGGEEQGTFGWIDSNVHRQQWLSVVDNRAWAINVVHKGKGIVLKDTYESRVVFRRLVLTLTYILQTCIVTGQKNRGI